jgi:hypothetical protein
LLPASSTNFRDKYQHFGLILVLKTLSSFKFIQEYLKKLENVDFKGIKLTGEEKVPIFIAIRL